MPTANTILANDGTGDFGPGTPGTQTAGWQEALDYLGTKGGGFLAVKNGVLGTPFDIYTSIKLNANHWGVTVEGYGDSTPQVIPNYPWPPEANGIQPYGGVLVRQNTADQHIFEVWDMLLAFSMKRIAMMFASTVSSTGHGISAAAPPSTSTNPLQATFAHGSTFDQIHVYNVDKNHYGYYFENFLECEMGFLMASQCKGGTFHFAGTNVNMNWGNTAIRHLYGVGGNDPSYVGAHMEFLSVGANNLLNMIGVGRLSSLPKNAGINLKIQGLRASDFHGLDMEGAVSQSLLQVSQCNGLYMQEDFASSNGPNPIDYDISQSRACSFQVHDNLRIQDLSNAQSNRYDVPPNYGGVFTGNAQKVV